MGTRSTMKFISKRGKELTPLVNIYQQYDGYVTGVGHELAKWLKNKTLINGIGDNQNNDNYANDFGCLVAQYIRDFKKGVGGLYITDMDDKEEYNYEVIFDEDKYFDGDYDTINDAITIIVDSHPRFEGTPSELLAFKETDDDDE